MSKSPPKVGQAVVEPRKVLDAAMTERELFESVRAHLDAFGWLWYHTYDSRRSGAGFPDIFAIRKGKALAIELKSQRGQLTDEQWRWFIAFDVAGIDCHLWRPSHLSDGTIEECLRGGGGTQ